MSLESQIAALVQSTSGLTQEVANKQAQVDARVAAKIAELEAWRAGARAEYPVVNLLANSRFAADGNADGYPDGYYSYYSGGTPSYALIAPDAAAAAGSDAKIASDLVASITDTIGFALSMKVMKVALAASATSGAADTWSLNQAIQLARGRYSRGISVYVKTVGTAKVLITDNPGGQSVVAQLNAVQTLFETGNAGGQSGGFLLSCFDRSAPTTLYLAAPWFADGYCDHWPSAIESR